MKLSPVLVSQTAANFAVDRLLNRYLVARCNVFAIMYIVSGYSFLLTCLQGRWRILIADVGGDNGLERGIWGFAELWNFCLQKIR